MKALILNLLRRLKCLIVGHYRDTWTVEAYSRPGHWRCARCLRFKRASDPMGLQHAVVLRRAGWTDDEINRLAFKRVPNSEVLRFLREVKKAAEAPVVSLPGQKPPTLIDHYEQGYIMGYYAALRDTK